MLDKIGVKFRATPKTLQGLVDSVDVSSIVANAKDSITLDLLDAVNPEVNGVKLLEHPHRGEEFQRVLGVGGRIAVIKRNGVITTIVTRTLSGGVGKKLHDFDSVLTDVRNNLAASLVGQAIKGNFVSGRGRLRRPKVMNPEDFWFQFTEVDLSLVKASTETSVIDFVEFINGLEKVNLKAKKVKDGLRVLIDARLVGKKTLGRLRN